MARLSPLALLGLRRRRKPTPQASAPRRAPFTPRVEQLEDRLAPAVGLTPNQNFVDRLYRDLLNRPADPGGLALFSGLLDSGVSRAQVALDIENSVEYRVDEAQGLYHQILNRDADAQGLVVSSAYLFNGGSYFVLGALLASSGEYYSTHGGSIDGYVGGLFQTFLKRPANTVDQNFWDEQLTRVQLTPFQVALDLFQSGEGVAALVDGVSEQFLRRHPTSTESSLWSGLALTAGVDSLIAGIAALPEYGHITSVHATHLVPVSQPPASTVAGVGFGTSVEAVDDSGQLDLTYTGNVTAAIGTNPSGGTLSGTQTVAAFHGVASFSGLSIDKVGTGYTLAFIASGLNGVTSNPFSITPAAATHVLFTTQPPQTTVAGAGFGSTVTAFDQFNNVDTNFAGTVTLAIGNNPSGSSLFGASQLSAVNGVASFTGLSLNKVGAGYTLRASSASLAGDVSTGITVTPAAATQLAFTTQPPQTTTAGTKFTTVVTAEDQFGNTDTNFNGQAVQVALNQNGNTGTFDGTYNPTTQVTTPGSLALTQNTVNGVATFASHYIDKNSGANAYSLTATSGTLTSASSGNVTITPGTAAFPIFTPQPTSPVNVGSNFPISITVVDAFGNTGPAYPDNQTMTVTLNQNGNTGTFDGVPGKVLLTALSAGGTANFGMHSISQSGNGYSLTAAGPTLTSITSTAFNVAQLAVNISTPTSSANPSNLGASVTFSVTVSSATNPQPAGGNVQFFNGGSPMGAPQPLVSTTASFTTTSLGAGNHSITAQYLGDSNHSMSVVSAPLTQVVNKHALTLGAISRSPGGSQTADTTFTFSVTLGGTLVPGFALSGSLQFASNHVTVPGFAGIPVSALQAYNSTAVQLAATTHSITVTLNDPNYSAPSPAALVVTFSEMGDDVENPNSVADADDTFS